MELVPLSVLRKLKLGTTIELHSYERRVAFAGFAGLSEAGDIEGGRRLLRCLVQLEQIHRLRATRPLCRTAKEERPVRDRLG